MERVVRLAQLLRTPVVGGGGEVVGRLADVIVRLRGRDYPLVTGLVARVGAREVFLPAEQVADLDAERITLASPRVDLRHFERREGEVLLRADVLGHRVIDVADVELVRAYDIGLEQRLDQWVLTCLDTRRPPHFWSLLRGRAGRPHWRDWKSFEPLIGHARSARVRGPFARLITERFGRFWGWFSVGDLFLLNFLTIVTEFIGVSLAAGYLGVSRYVVVPVAAVVLVAVTASGSFRRWERAMFVFIGASLLLIPLTLMSRPRWGHAAHAFVVPGIQGGASGEAVLLIIAIAGTTVAPWQLFFQQSNVIDKRITPRFIGYERADTVIGSFVVVAGAAALIMTADFAARGTAVQGHFTDAAGVADALGRHDPVLGVLFAVVLLDASIIGAAAVTLATSYAFGDVFNLRHSLHRSFGEAKQFYASYSLLVLVAAAIVLIPGAPLGLITEAVQALAGVLLPSASVFLLLLCNDTEVLGPWVNPRWLNVLATVIIAVLLMLSGTLMATTLFPAVNVMRLTIWLAIALVTGLIAAAVALRAARRSVPARQVPVMSQTERLAWRMPPLALLRPVRWSAGTRLGMMALRGYLILSALLLLIKAIRLGGS